MNLAVFRRAGSAPRSNTVLFASLWLGPGLSASQPNDDGGLPPIQCGPCPQLNPIAAVPSNRTNGDLCVVLGSEDAWQALKPTRWWSTG